MGCCNQCKGTFAFGHVLLLVQEAAMGCGNRAYLHVSLGVESTVFFPLMFGKADLIVELDKFKVDVDNASVTSS